MTDRNETNITNLASVLHQDAGEGVLLAKLHWLHRASIAPDVTPHDFEVLFAIATHINPRSGRGMLSDSLIASYTATSRKHVLAARAHLRELGWLTWTRTKTANVYALPGLFGEVQAA